MQNVKSLRNNLLLTPQNTKVLGYSVSHLEDEQPRLFLESLMIRMGKPVPAAAQASPSAPVAVQQQRSTATRSAPPAQSRAPAPTRSAAAGSSRSEEEIQRARAARAAALAAATEGDVTIAVPPRVVRPVARRAGSSANGTPALGKRKASAQSEYSDIEPIEIPDSDDSDMASDENVPPQSQRAASKAASRNPKHLYDQTFDSMDADDNLMLLATDEPALAHQAHQTRSRLRRKTSDASTRSAWFEVDEEKTSSNRAATSSWQAEQRGRREEMGNGINGYGSEGYSIVDDDDFDDSFIRQVAEVEARSFARQGR